MDRQRRDAIIAGVIITAAIAFLAWLGTYLDTVLAMWVTFIPAAVLAYVAHLLTTNRRMPDPQRILPLYLLAFGWQLLHFAEEFSTNLQGRYPAEIFGGTAYSANFLVVFNMVAYFAFLVPGGIALYRGLHLPAITAWLFIMAGVVVNAILHPAISLVVGGYFPGLYTSLLFWVLGPLLITLLWRETRPPATTSQAPVTATLTS